MTFNNEINSAPLPAAATFTLNTQPDRPKAAAAGHAPCSSSGCDWSRAGTSATSIGRKLTSIKNVLGFLVPQCQVWLSISASHEFICDWLNLLPSTSLSQVRPSSSALTYGYLTASPSAQHCLRLMSDYWCWVWIISRVFQWSPDIGAILFIRSKHVLISQKVQFSIHDETFNFWHYLAY